MAETELLRAIPKIDELLCSEALRELDVPHALLTGCARQTVESLREGILRGEVAAVPDISVLARQTAALAARKNLPNLRPVINATGVVLHTNLGRAPLAEAAAKAAYDAAVNYSTLEYDVESGGRGSRYSHVESLLTGLTGAEAAMAVNNNAAAVLLILSALGKGREAIVSRGELVEIGGSFRVPDIMESCGCILREVGTTNKTHLRDYEAAVGESSFAILKVHTSNFRIVGFTESPELSELAELAHRAGILLIEDLGSGALCPPESFGIADEPYARSSIKAGADIVSFSGDKLLGGPQAGIIVGRKKYIDILKKHPLTRAMRVDKMTLAALEASLRIYAAGREAEEIPVLSMLRADSSELEARARQLAGLIREKGVKCTVVPACGRVGGGSAPLTGLSGWAVAVCDERLSANSLEKALRLARQPLIGRINEGHFCLDVRTLLPGQDKTAAELVAEAFV